MARLAKDADFNFVKKSWVECFDDPPEFVNWNFEYNYNAENTVIAEADGEPASVMQLVPYSLRMGDSELKMRYVSGVATMPEYRGKGLVRELFDFGIPMMEKMGCHISMLIPAVEGMYEKFGYRKVCKRFTYTTKSVEGIKAYNRIDDELISVLDRMYMDAMKEKSVYIIRSRENWEKILTDLICLSGGFALINENVGYALAYPKGEEYEVIEAFGETGFDLVCSEIPSIMARIIDKNTFSDDVEELFKALTEEKEAYINLLL